MSKTIDLDLLSVQKESDFEQIPVIEQQRITSSLFCIDKFIYLRTMLYQGIKCQLNGNPGVKDHHLSTRPKDTETVVGIQKGTNGLSSGFSDNLRFVCHLQVWSHRQIIGPRQCIVVLLLLLLLMKIHGFCCCIRIRVFSV